MNSSLRFLLTSSRDDWAAPILASDRSPGESPRPPRGSMDLCGRASAVFGAARRTRPGLTFSLCLAASGPSPWRCVWPPVASYGLRSRCPLCLLVICAAEREFRGRACGAFLARKDGWRRVENARKAVSGGPFSSTQCLVGTSDAMCWTWTRLLSLPAQPICIVQQQQSRIRLTRSLCCRKTRCSPPSRRC